MKKAVITGMMLLALYGCGDKKPKNVSEDYVKKPQISEENTQISELEGRIIKTKTSRLTFSKESSREARSPSQHEFEYVVIEDKEGGIHTLMYPYSMPILKRNAKIKYKILPNKVLDGRAFVDMFINNSYSIDDMIVIEAEGIIQKDGIEYKKF
ncbi:MAG: hypothetical protein V1645_04585 [archaeon]